LDHFGASVSYCSARVAVAEPEVLLEPRDDLASLDVGPSEAVFGSKPLELLRSLARLLLNVVQIGLEGHLDSPR
jgi:hypothetical protein